MKIEAVVVRAFTKDGAGGNPAGVVLDAAGLDASMMQAAAAKLGFSETAFVQPSELADFQVRFFTPKAEVDLCGHATIAAFALLSRDGRLPAGAYSQQTAAGILPIEIKADGSVFMDQPAPSFLERVPKEELADALGLSRAAIASPPQVVSTGLRDILVHVADRKSLLAMKPDLGKVSRLSERVDAVGVHAFCLDPVDRAAAAHCRNFAPRVGIDEESATGTSNGALACYLFESGRLSAEACRDLVFEQGYAMDLPSEIRAGLSVDGRRVGRVQVGGKAALAGRTVLPC